MKKTIYYTLSGLLLGIGADVPFMFSFGVCSFGGGQLVQWCAVLSFVALWALPIIGCIVGLLIARKSIKKSYLLASTGASDRSTATINDQGLKKILFFSSLPLIFFLIWYIFSIIRLDVDSNIPKPIPQIQY